MGDATTERVALRAVRTFVFSSKRPFGVSIMIAGGLKGYSEGSKMRKW